MKMSRQLVQTIGLVAVTLLGAVLRFRGLGFKEFWYDEACTGLTIAGNWREMYFILIRDIHPPFYYILAKVWANLFGYTDFGIRSLSAVLGVLLIPLIFVFVRKASGSCKDTTAFFVSLLIAVNPFLITYSQEARAYALLAFLFVLAAYFFYFGLMKSPLKFNLDWLLFSIFIFLLALTHYISFFGIGSFFVFMAGYHVWDKNILKNKFKLVSLMAKITAIFVSLFLIWLPSFRLQRLNISDLGLTWGWIPKPEFSFISKSLYAFLFGVERKVIGVPPVVELTPMLSSNSLAFILFSIILGISVYIFFKKRSGAFLTFVLTMWFLPILFTIIASFFGYNLYVERYLIGYGVFFLIYLGLILFSLGKRKAHILLAVAIFYMFVVFTTHPVAPSNLGYRNLVAGLQNAEGKIVFSNPLEFVVAKYYLGNKFDSRIRVYDFVGEDNYQGWVLIGEYQVLRSFSQIDNGDVVVATDPPMGYKYKRSYNEGGFKVYSN